MCDKQRTSEIMQVQETCKTNEMSDTKVCKSQSTLQVQRRPSLKVSLSSVYKFLLDSTLGGQIYLFGLKYMNIRLKIKLHHFKYNNSSNINTIFICFTSRFMM